MKRLLIFLFCLPFLATAQNKPLIAEGVFPDLYINHTVAPKENYYSVGRMYNISPKEIAPFNNLQLEKGLSLNQVIKVPLTAGNFIQSGDAGADEVLVPVYHTVQGKEGLYRVSVSYNKLPIETLKKWNKITGDAVANGTKLIVGYLKVKKDLSPLASMAKAKPADDAAIIAKEKNEPAAQTPVKKEPVAVTKEKEPVKKEQPVVVKEKEPVVEVPVKNEPVAAKATETVKPSYSGTGKNFNGGTFKTEYDKQAKNNELANETGAAAIFKSTSGWDDGKYYCFHNTALSGSIIRITNAATGKTIYAKVLDVIPDIKQNAGILICISNAAAEGLGVSDAKFDCTLSYSK